MEMVDFGYINAWLTFYAWIVAGFCGLILATVMGLPFEITVLSLIRIKGDQIKRDSIALFIMVCLFAGSTYLASNALHDQMDEEKHRHCRSSRGGSVAKSDPGPVWQRIVP
jgi:hypothetical protein